ncbi:HET domain-containing protein [Fusarium keratoplasticum]|nr:HET domain-containing protein [Fusarium keratoplasticum]
MLSPFESLNQEEPGSRGALWQAASGGYYVIVQLLLDNYPMPLDSYDCFMALCEAAKLGHVEVIKALLEKFPRGQRWKFHLNVAACWAVAGMQPASIDILIKRLEDVEVMEPFSRDICLLVKVLSGDEAIARLFLEKGADVDSPIAADNILTMAERWPGLQRVTIPLCFGAPLSKATKLWLRPYLNTALLEYGANTEAKIKEGKTVLFYAVSLGHGSIVRQLLKHGANKEERDEDGWSLLIAAVSIFADTTDSDMLELLLDEGADVEAKDKDGNTPLMHGAWCLTTVKLLLARGADVNARSKHGVTPLMKAAFYKENADVVKLFLEHGADPTAKDERDRTAASQANDEAVLTLLRGYSERSWR